LIGEPTSSVISAWRFMRSRFPFCYCCHHVVD